MKVLVCGSRTWNRPALIAARISELPSDTHVIHGAARGADELAGRYAHALAMSVSAFPANWDEYGKRAGIIRNLDMLDQHPDLVIAFWDGKSRGTKHAIDEAEERGIRVEIIYEQGGTDWR